MYFNTRKFILDYLFFYRLLDLEMNIVLLCIALKYDVETDSIVAKLIIMYSSIAVGVVQLLKAAF